MEKEYVVKLDVYLGVLEARVISFNQLNTGTCKLEFELTSNKQALDLTGKKSTFEVTTPGGATLEDAILITDATQGKCECTLANDMIAEQGMHYAEINVYSKNNTKLLTFNKFRYIVNGQLGAKDITVDTRYSTLQELILEVENLKNQSVIDTDAVTQMKNETDLMHKDVIVKHGNVEIKHQEVVTLAQSVKDDASRTASNAQQVSTDKGIVTKAKNEVVAKHDEVLKTAGVIAQDKVIVEQAKTEIVGYKNDVEAMKNDVQQLVTDSTEDLILEGNKQVTRISTEGTTQVNLAKAEVTKATQQATVATEQAGIAQSHAETAQGELSKVTAEGVKQVKAVSDKGVEQVQAVATEGAKQIELAKTEVIKAESAATLATREADRAGAQAQEKVNSKIGHNGVFDDTIFNFIRSKVVQDGLIGSVFSSTPKTVKINKSSNYTIQFVGKYNQIHRIYSAIFGIYDTVAHFYMDSNSENKEELRLRAGDNIIYASSIVKNFNELFQETSNLLIEIDVKNSLIKVNLNGISKQYSYTPKEMQETLNLYLLKTTIDNSNFDGEVKGLLVYDRALNQQEITRNFSVLNNAPAIKELHNTDSTGKTSILKLGSDEDHVEMSTGRTLREEYMGVLKTMGKEFTSTDGTPIQVPNGIEARVINAEIKGHTVKNYCPTIKKSNMSISGLTSVDDEKHLITLNGNGVFNNAFINYNGGLEPNKKYKVVIYIHSNTMSGNIIICGTSIDEVWSTGSIYVKQGENGIVSSILTTKEDLSNTKQIIRTYSSSANPTGTLVYSVIVIDENAPVPTSYIPFGLHSTKAIISNNGQQYPIYATEEDKANKKVILLGRVGDVQDTLEIKKDGSGMWLQNVFIKTLVGNEPGWAKENPLTDEQFICFKLNDDTFSNVPTNVNLNATCNLLPISSYAKTTSSKTRCYFQAWTSHFVMLRKDELNGDTVEDFKMWLKENNLIIKYKILTPIITYIPKELMPTIFTHNQTNIWEVGGAVRASSYKITQPVDAVGEIRAELEEIKKQLGAVAALQLGQIN